MDLDTSAFMEIVGNKETVTLFSRATESTFSPTDGTSVANAKRRAPTKSEQQAGDNALLAQVELVWHLATAELGGVAPKVNDVIQDSSAVRWSVVQVEVQSLVNRYRCSCQRER